MNNLKQLFKTPSPLSNKVLLTIISVIALVGIADTTYLLVNSYFGTQAKCLVTEGCEVVLTSPYSKIIGIPVAVFGFLFYASIFILAGVADIYGEKKFIKTLLLAGGITGFTVSLVFLYLQLFIIRALCFYCLASLFISTAIFILSVVSYRKVPSTHN